MSEQRSKKRIAVIIILAFVLPILVLLAVMAICGVIPFGSKSTLVWDYCNTKIIMDICGMCFMVRRA